MQGRAASEIDTADELVASELMFNGTFGKLDKHQLAALVSCLVPVENSNVSQVQCGAAVCHFLISILTVLVSNSLQAEVKLLGDLANALAHLHDAVQHIISVSNECKLEIDAGDILVYIRIYCIEFNVWPSEIISVDWIFFLAWPLHRDILGQFQTVAHGCCQRMEQGGNFCGSLQ